MGLHLVSHSLMSLTFADTVERDAWLAALAANVEQQHRLAPELDHLEITTAPGKDAAEGGPVELIADVPATLMAALPDAPAPVRLPDEPGLARIDCVLGVNSIEPVDYDGVFTAVRVVLNEPVIEGLLADMAIARAHGFSEVRRDLESMGIEVTFGHGGRPCDEHGFRSGPERMESGRIEAPEVAICDACVRFTGLLDHSDIAITSEALRELDLYLSILAGLPTIRIPPIDCCSATFLPLYCHSRQEEITPPRAIIHD